MRVLASALLLLLASSASAQWITIKGQVVFPAGVAPPQRNKLNVTQDKDHCLSKGAILDDMILINPKNRGVKNVVVWLRPGNKGAAAFSANEIHPADAKRKPLEVVIDQPCCMFVPRVTACRVGDTIVVKNPAPVAHNFFWSSANNGELNVTIASKESYKFKKPLEAEGHAIPFKCTIHPWMSGQVRVFDHPYFAVTDEDGRFTIKDAPAGNYRILYSHENVGFKGGAAGRFGDAIAIAAGANNTMEMKPTGFNVK
jgi:plastocyanin